MTAPWQQRAPLPPALPKTASLIRNLIHESPIYLRSGMFTYPSESGFYFSPKDDLLYFNTSTPPVFFFSVIIGPSGILKLAQILFAYSYPANNQRLIKINFFTPTSLFQEFYFSLYSLNSSSNIKIYFYIYILLYKYFYINLQLKIVYINGIHSLFC